MKKTLLLLAMAFVSLCSNAQDFTAKREAPAPPKFSAWKAETESYMWNVSLGGFFINHQGATGAPYYGTAASVNDTIGTLVNFTRTNPNVDQADTENEIWSSSFAKETTFLLTSYVTKFSEFRCAFTDGWMWTDNNDQPRRFFDVAVDGDGYITFTGNYGCINLFDGSIVEDIWSDKPLGVNADRIVQIGEPNFKWAMVSAEDYEAYMADIDVKIEQLKIIAAANSLKASIEDAVAKYEGIDISAALAVYNNMEATEEDLLAGIDLVKKAITDYQKGQASVDNPADMTDLVPNNDFENGTDGWTSTTGAQNKGTATNKGVDADFPGTTITGKFWENWNPSNFEGKMYTTISNLPGGVYSVSMDACGGSDTWVYANDSKTRTGGVNSYGEDGLELGGTAYKFQVYTLVGDDGILELGLVNLTDCNNWNGIDNVKLSYYGDALDSYKFWYKSVRGQIVDHMNSLVTPETKYDKNQKAIFQAALAKGDAAASKEDIISAVAELQAASDATLASITAYNDLVKDIAKIEADLAESEYEDGTLINYFADFMAADDKGAQDDAIAEFKAQEVPAELIPEIAPLILLEECTYNTEQVQAYAELLHGLYAYAVAHSLTPGMDFTHMISDADFTDANGKGWNIATKPTNWTWTAGLSAFPCAESYHSYFDIYQDVEAPDGIYSVSLNGFCRLDDGVDTEVPAEIYLNDFATPLMNIADGAISEDDAVDGVNAYLTADSWKNNSDLAESKVAGSTGVDKTVDGGYIPDGMIGASVAFYGGRYKATVYGLVEGGKMRLGLRNTKSTHVWALWGNFKLRYEGKTPEAVKAVAEAYAETASNFLENHSEEMSEPIKTALEAAITAAQDDSDVDTQYAAIAALNKAMVASNENAKAVVAFTNAKDAMTTAAEEYYAEATAEAKAKYDKLAGVEFANMTTEEIIAATAEFDDAAAALKVPAGDEASDDNPIDFTRVIINPDFEANSKGQQATGWTLVKPEGAEGNYQVQTGMNGGVSMEFWSNSNGEKTKFDFFQELTNLPAGTYVLTATAANSLNDQAQGPGEGAAYIYAAAKNGSALDMHYSDPVEIQTEGCADKGAEYTVVIKLEEGETLVIGAQNVGVLGARWVMIDDFKLEYCGKNSSKEESTEVESVPTDNVAVATAVYSATGARLNGLQKGINLVKMSDGTVRKMIIK